MDERASIPVGLPVPNPTTSYWQDPPDEIADYKSSASLADELDTVIIGSGITGACIAYNLLASDSYNGEKILMLEARQACSGATGRNGKPPTMLLYYPKRERRGICSAKIK